MELQRKTLHEVIKEYVEHALVLNGWKVKEAAKFLGVGRATVYRKIQEYGLKKPENIK